MNCVINAQRSRRHPQTANPSKARNKEGSAAFECDRCNLLLPFHPLSRVRQTRVAQLPHLLEEAGKSVTRVVALQKLFHLLTPTCKHIHVPWGGKKREREKKSPSYITRCLPAAQNTTPNWNGLTNGSTRCTTMGQSHATCLLVWFARPITPVPSVLPFTYPTCRSLRRAPLIISWENQAVWFSIVAGTLALLCKTGSCISI